METRFQRGDKVRIKECPIVPSVVGKKGTIVRVRVVKDGVVDGNAVENVVLYKVRVGGFYVPQYATEDCLEAVDSPHGKPRGTVAGKEEA